MGTESNEDLIQKLKEDIQQGEDQDLEFMEDYPSNEHELKKEIAAFASSNAGTIYLGIDDDCNISGMSIFKNNSFQDGKDKIMKNLYGLCQNAIKPPIQITVDLIKCPENIIIAKLNIPKGIEPVYYSNNRPYVRNLTSSTPATPEQVKELHRKYFLSELLGEPSTEKQNFLNQVSNQLSDFQILWCDIENRNVNPDLDQNIYDISKTAEILENLSLDPTAKELSLNEDLDRLSDKLDNMAHHKFFLDGGLSWNSFIEKGNEAFELDNMILNRLQKNHRTQQSEIESIKKILVKNIKELQINWQKREKYSEYGELAKLRETFRQLSYNFNRIANLPLQLYSTDVPISLRKVAKNLREISSYKTFVFNQNAIKDIMDENMTIVSSILKEIEE
ncbi:MAG: ATP-binding protein [Methanotrichaceae archaeon]|nr:ATP-binding protein [Methanotrichaceae archaeon]